MVNLYVFLFIIMKLTYTIRLRNFLTYVQKTKYFLYIHLVIKFEIFQIILCCSAMNCIKIIFTENMISMFNVNGILVIKIIYTIKRAISIIYFKHTLFPKIIFKDIFYIYLITCSCLFYSKMETWFSFFANIGGRHKPPNPDRRFETLCRRNSSVY